MDPPRIHPGSSQGCCCPTELQASPDCPLSPGRGTEGAGDALEAAQSGRDRDLLELSLCQPFSCCCCTRFSGSFSQSLTCREGDLAAMGLFWGFLSPEHNSGHLTAETRAAPKLCWFLVAPIPSQGLCGSFTLRALPWTPQASPRAPQPRGFHVWLWIRADSRLGHARGRGCSSVWMLLTPLHPWGDDSLLSSPLHFALGFPEAWEWLFSHLGLTCSRSVGIRSQRCCSRIQLELLGLPWLSPKIASPARAASRALCWDEFSFPQKPLSQELQHPRLDLHPGEGRECGPVGKLRHVDDFGAGSRAASLQPGCSPSAAFPGSSTSWGTAGTPHFPRYAPFNYP